jgi:hypothetical protein
MPLAGSDGINVAFVALLSIPAIGSWPRLSPRLSRPVRLALIRIGRIRHRRLSRNNLGIFFKGFSAMTPEQKIKWAILLRAAELNGEPAPEVTSENIDDVCEELAEEDIYWDAKSEVRGGQVETGLPSPRSRHYESKAVAAQLPDGSWVGWTYWYGGGKYGEPEAIDWMAEAYDLDCQEEEKLVVVRTFTLREPVAA